MLVRCKSQISLVHFLDEIFLNVRNLTFHAESVPIVGVERERGVARSQSGGSAYSLQAELRSLLRALTFFLPSHPL